MESPIINKNYFKNNTIFNHDSYIINNDLKFSINISEREEFSNTDYDKICVKLSKYSAMLFSGLIIHGSKPNKSNQRRCGMVYRFTIKNFSYSDNKPKFLTGNVPYNPRSILLKETCLKLEESCWRNIW